MLKKHTNLSSRIEGTSYLPNPSRFRIPNPLITNRYFSADQAEVPVPNWLAAHLSSVHTPIASQRHSREPL